MRARRIGRALRFAAPALAAVSVAAAGGSVVALARADEPPCDEATGVARGEALPCAETVPPPTATETGPVEGPPPETEPVPTTPPPVVTTTTTPPPAKRPSPAKTAASPGAPATSPGSSGGTYSSGTRIGSPPNSETPELSGGPYVFPVLGATTFADTWGAPRATVAWHHGVDIFAPLGTPIVAVADGVLFSVGWNRIGGQRLWLRDREGNYFYYAHLSGFSPLAVEGARVRAGTVIGYLGNTGDAVGTPYHLHFEIHPVSLLALGYDGAVDPFPYVSAWRQLDHALDGPSTAGSSTAAPAAGAFLLDFTDISSTSGLSPGSLKRTLEAAAVSAAVVHEPEYSGATRSRRGTIRPLSAADARVARSLDAEAARPARYSASVWDGLAACESGGNWGANTGNGYVGGLQFLPETWVSHGGSAFAASAHLATREQQIAIAERVLASQGWRAWPACSAMLGLQALENG